VRWVVTVTALEGALAFGTLAFVPSRLVSTLGFSPSMAGGVMMLYGVGGLLYSQFVPRWLRLLGERGLALLGGGLIALSLWRWPSCRGRRWRSRLASWPGSASTCFITRCRPRPPRWRRMRGSAVTLFACLLFLGQSLGVVLVGSVVDGGGLDLAMALAGLGVLALAFAVSRRVAGRIAVPA
jgi:predicted MFS family arabinose efflux permease